MRTISFIIPSQSTVAFWLGSQLGERGDKKELCNIAYVQKTRTTPFCPLGNPFAERFNRSLIHMLHTLADDYKANWADYVPSLCQAYNATKSYQQDFHPTSLNVWMVPMPLNGCIFRHNIRECAWRKPYYVSWIQDHLWYAYRLVGEASRQQANPSTQGDSSNHLKALVNG